MKKILYIFFIFLTFLFSTNNTFAQNNTSENTDQNLNLIEKIHIFESIIIINKDGSINVEEKIKYDFNHNLKHGIFRNVPLKKKINQKEYYLEIRDIDVVDDNNKKYYFEKSKVRDFLKIKIGDPNKLISGDHTYIIKYKVLGALTYFKDFDELYWNVNGNEWEVPIDFMAGRVSFPYLSKVDFKFKCFTGRVGSIQTECIGIDDRNFLTIRTQRILNPREGLTIVVSFPKNIVAVLNPTPVINFFDTTAGKVTMFFLGILAFLWYVFLPIYLIYKWYKYGRDPSTNSGQVQKSVARFEPPKLNNRFLTAAESGTIIDEDAGKKETVALIIQLAQKGYMRIINKENNTFILQQMTKPLKDLQGFEKFFLEDLFAQKNQINLHDDNIYDTVYVTQKMIYENLTKDKCFNENPYLVKVKYEALAGAALGTLNFHLAIISYIFGRNIARRTELGVNLKNQAKSLKNFLVSQDRQFEFQAKNKMLFEKLLPYAIAFGVEKIWEKRFVNLSKYETNWYVSNNGFSVVDAMRLQMFSSLVTSASTNISSSGMVGGFSGGGGGGGGGGSW